MKYENILRLREPRKSGLLANLIAETESYYEILRIKNEAYEKGDKEVIEVYRKISEKRSD